MDNRKLKEGKLLTYKRHILTKRWSECYAVLFSDSSFCWYNEKGDSRPSGSVLLKDVVPYICIGLMCDRMPVQRPKLPNGHSIHHLVGIGMDPRAEKVFWFLFASDSDFESWFNEITKTLPKPNPSPPGPQLPTANQAPVYNPPPVYPNAPAPMGPVTNPVPQTYPSQPVPPYSNIAAYGGGRPGPPYGPAGAGSAGGTTVIVHDRPYSSGGSCGVGSGLGFGSGMLMGSLLGYGLGSFWGGGLYPHHGFGGGFGGGYIQDNDTNITNNYYYGGDTNNYNVTDANNPSTTDVSADHGTTEVLETGGDYDGYDISSGFDGDIGGGFGDIGGGFDF
ncbi:hypothetical protein AB6A40_006308 [Gnathostoma spinigerum]|uniref:PH domain-containing protein n=1 Tax=Gnathostoma spinigerum TaxID=75299 RepID=A0ABD6EN85_9BILA